MTSEPVIACSLSANDQARRFDIAADLRRRALVRSEPIPGGLRLVFSDQVGVRDELTDLVEAESACCSFLDFRFSSHHEQLVLEVTGPEEADPVIRSLFGSVSTTPGQ